MGLKDYLRREKYNLFRELGVTILISAIVTTLLSFVFDKKLDERAADRQFIFDFGRTFFDIPKYRNISTAIEEQYLYGRGNILKTNGGQFTDYEVDDYLGLLYDLWIHGENQLISDKLVANQFVYYLCVTYQNNEIREYRKRLEHNGFSKVMAYSFLDDFAKKIEVFDNNCKQIQ